MNTNVSTTTTVKKEITMGRFTPFKTEEQALQLEVARFVLDSNKLAKAYTKAVHYLAGAELNQLQTATKKFWAQSAELRAKVSEVSIPSLAEELALFEETQNIFDSVLAEKTAYVAGLNRTGIMCRVVGSKYLMTYQTVKAGGIRAENVYAQTFPHSEARVQFQITEDTFSAENLELVSRVLVTPDRAQVFAVDAERITRELGIPCGSLSLVLVLIMLDTVEWDPSAMKDCDTLYMGIACSSQAPMIVSPWHFPPINIAFGITSSTQIESGYAKKLELIPGWLEASDIPGKYKTFDKKKKVVARIDKLHKEGELGDEDDRYRTIKLNNVFLVDHVVSGNEEAVRDALSTGVIWTTADTIITNGQCRVVSTAAKLGIKGTLNLVGLLAPQLETAGITLIGTGSAKASGYGLTRLKNKETSLNVRVLGVDTKIHGYLIEEVEVIVTNNYLIHQYMPAELGTNLESWEDTLEYMATKEEERNSFISKVLTQAQGRPLLVALEELTNSGEIVAKPATTSITPTEFDVWAHYEDRGFVAKVMESVAKHPANAEKLSQIRLVAQAMSGSFDADQVIHRSLPEVLQIAASAAKAAGFGPNVIGSAAPSREFLVNFVDGLYGVKGEEAPKPFLMISFAESFCLIPTGKLFEGATFNSSPYLPSVVASGVLSRILPKIKFASTYAFKGVEAPYDVLQATFEDIASEVEANLCGKKLGRLSVKGGYHVLSVAPWAANRHTVYAPNALVKFGKGKKVLVTKHPTLFQESHKGAEITSKFKEFKALAGGCMSDAKLQLALASLGDTVMCHKDMLLALQDDCDGDLARITYHGDEIEFPMFEASAYDAPLTGAWHRASCEDEEAIFNKASKLSEPMLVEHHELLQGCLAGGMAKANVAMFTANSQKVQQNFALSLPKGKYKGIVTVLNSWVQLYAMNVIKHDDLEGQSVADIFYHKDIESLEEKTGKTYKELAQNAFNAYIDEIGADEGYKRYALEFLEIVREAIAVPTAPGIQMIAKNRDGGQCREMQSIVGKDLFDNGSSLIGDIIRIAFDV